MTFRITGLPPETFAPMIGLSDAALAARGAVRRTADKKPGYPCRITLEDAEPGETLLLLNHESHVAPTPYRSSYAIFVRESAREAASFVDELPPVFRGRPIALRLFDREGMLIGADLALPGDNLKAKIERALEDPNVDHIDAHNAAHGCFAARVTRA